MSKPLYKEGDWLRFMRSCELYIGVVEYINPKDVLGNYEYITNIGKVKEDEVIEVRRNK